MSPTVDYKLRSALLYNQTSRWRWVFIPFAIHDAVSTCSHGKFFFFARYNATDETMEIVETGLGGEQKKDLPCEIVLVVIPILKKLFYYVYATNDRITFPFSQFRFTSANQRCLRLWIISFGLRCFTVRHRGGAGCLYLLPYTIRSVLIRMASSSSSLVTTILMKLWR